MSIPYLDLARKSVASDAPTPPFNLQAEQALLGALLISNQGAEYIPDLAAGHFFDELHGRIFEVMSECLLAGRSFTATTLAERFRTFIIDENTNGSQYLGRLMANATTISNVREYARTIIECAQRRALIVIAEDVAARAFDPNDPASPSELIEEAERKQFHASISGKNGQEVAYSDAIAQALDAANTARMDGGGIKGVQTGFIDLDKRLGGLGDGNLVVIAGRPSMGKTALALNIAANVAQTGDFVHIFSMEMNSTELGMRQLGEFSGVASDRLRRGDFTDLDFRSMSDAARRLSGLPMLIDETGGINIASLATKARRVKRRRNTKLIVIDYLQIMGTPPGRGGNRVNDITDITIGLKALAKELGVPVIVLSQLSREVEKRTDKRPQLSDLRESGSIEQDADVVMFLYREEYYLERQKPDENDFTAFADWQRKMAGAHGKAEVIVGKQRHGQVGIVDMAFDGALTRFSDLARESQS